MSTGTVVDEVERERAVQDINKMSRYDKQWTPFDWHEMIADYNAWARRCACKEDLHEARKRYIQLAAIVVAAVEALDYKMSGPEL